MISLISQMKMRLSNAPKATCLVRSRVVPHQGHCPTLALSHKEMFPKAGTVGYQARDHNDSQHNSTVRLTEQSWPVS